MTVRSLTDAAKSGIPEGLGRRERQRLETRNRLREAALEEFREAGVAGAQIDRIVEKVGVARGTFYFHFPTKEHVLLERQRLGEEEIVAKLRLLGPHPGDVRAFLRRVFDAILGSLDPEESLRREIMAMYIREPMRIEAAADPLVLEVVDYFADAAERGALRDDIAPEQLAISFLGSLPSLLMGSDAEIKSEAGLERLDIAIEIFLNGVSTR